MNKKKIAIIGGVLVALMLLIAIATALLISTRHNTVAYDGPSMEPTIHDKQTLVWVPYENGQTPQRDDLVLFTQTGLAKFIQKDSAQLVKRVVAIPGDRVVVADSGLKVFNKAHPDGYNPIKVKTIISGATDVKVPAHQYFVIGDNAPDSLDSRAFGMIKLETIKGRIDLDSKFAKVINDNK